METPSKTDRRLLTWISVAVVVATQLALALVGRRLPPEAAVVWCTALAAGATLAVAYIVAPLTKYSQAAHWISAAVLAGCIVVSARVVPAEAWLSSVRHELWLVFWFPLMMATLPAPRRAACSPGQARSGWVMVGVSAFLGATVTLAGLIIGWRHGS